MQRGPGNPSDATTTELRARGERLTPQRLMVLDVLRETGGHQTAEAIYERVRASYPYVNLATIYRALHWLKEQGLVCETDLGGGQAEYEYLDERHHHLVCLGCGGRWEFSDDLVRPLAAALRAQFAFEPRTDHLAIFGTCRRCQEAAENADTAVPDADRERRP